MMPRMRLVGLGKSRSQDPVVCALFSKALAKLEGVGVFCTFSMSPVDMPSVLV